MRPSSFTAVLAVAFLCDATNVLAEEVAPQFSCSATQTLFASDAYSVQCSGDLSVHGGHLTAANSISLSASGTLTLSGISISAPEISIFGGASISIGSDVGVTASNFVALHQGLQASGQPGTMFIAPGATISVAGRESIPLAASVGRVTQHGGSIQMTPGRLTVVPGVPEPSALLAMLSGVVCVLAYARRRQA